MTLPNKLTISRLVLTVVILFFLFLKMIPYNYVIALILFIIAMITDVLDGYIARKYHLITKFGSFLDPLADKLIIILVSVFLMSQQVYPLWLVLLLLSREIVVDAFRSFAVGQNIYVGAIKLGKFKALLQTVSNILGLFYLVIINSQFIFVISSVIIKESAFYLMLVAFLFSVVGLLVLFKNNSFALFKNIQR